MESLQTHITHGRADALVSVIEQRLANRRAGYKAALQERADLAEKNEALLQRLASGESMLPVAEPHEAEAIRQEQAQLRLERQPIKERLEELEKSFAEHVRRIEEDERLLEIAQFDENARELAASISGEAEDRKRWEDRLSELADLTKKLAGWEVLIIGRQRELGSQEQSPENLR